MLLSSAECRRAVITSRRLKVAPPHLVRALLLVATTSTAVFAQGVTGTLSGTVKDPQGAVVPGATVTVINESQGTEMAPVVTNATGDFVVPNVPAVRVRFEHTSIAVAMIIVLFYSIELVLNSIWRRWDVMRFTTYVTLALLGIRGVMGM